MHSFVCTTVYLFALFATAFGVRWTQYANKGTFIPAGRSQPAMGIIDDKMYVFGGRQDCSDHTSACLNSFFGDTVRYNFATEKWDDISSVPSPSPRANSAYATWANGHSLFVYGGATFNGTSTAPIQIHTLGDFWQFNALTHTWSQPVTNAGPGTRAGATTTVVGNKMYLFGGLTASFAVKNDLWVLDLPTFTWTLLIASNVTKDPHVRFLHYFEYNENSNTFLLSGGDAIPENTVVLNDLWSYSIEHNTWTFVTSGFQPQINGASATYKDAFLFAFGETRGNPAECFNSVTTFESNPTDRIMLSNIHAESHPEFGVARDKFGPGTQKMMGYTTYNKKLYIVFGFNWFCPEDNSGIFQYNRNVWSIPLAPMNQLVQAED